MPILRILSKPQTISNMFIDFLCISILDIIGEKKHICHRHFTKTPRVSPRESLDGYSEFCTPCSRTDFIGPLKWNDETTKRRSTRRDASNLDTKFFGQNDAEWCIPSGNPTWLTNPSDDFPNYKPPFFGFPIHSSSFVTNRQGTSGRYFQQKICGLKWLVF